MHSDFITGRVTIEPPFCHSLHFLWCMAQRSLHVVTKVYYRSMSCFPMVSHTNIPSCTMWFRQFTKYVTKTDHKVCWHPHWTEHDTQSIAYLISKQVVSYRTRGGTCCLRVSTPKIWSLADQAWQTTSPDGTQPSPPYQPCSNHSIDPHHGQMASQWMGDHLSQRHKPNSTSQWMERFVRHSWLSG
jgi:hypothetical protein